MTDPELIELNRQKILNQKLSLREFSKGKTTLESRPSKVTIELTENCNLKCIFCTQSYHERYKTNRPELDMPTETFSKIAKALFRNTYLVDLAGVGETTYMKNWMEILSMLEDYPLNNWHITTNLALSNELAWEKMVKSGFLMGISLDAATKKVFETIRTKSDFRTIEGNLKYLSNTIKKENKGFAYFITTVQKQNIDELPKVIELARKHNVNEVQFKMVRQLAGPDFHKEIILDSQLPALKISLAKSLDTAIDLKVRLTINDQYLLDLCDEEKVQKALKIPYVGPNLNFPLNTDKDPEFLSKNDWWPIDKKVLDQSKVAVYKRCFKPYHFTYVDTEGNIGPCPHLCSPWFPVMGSIRESDFDEIWNGEKYVTYREKLINTVAADERCGWCFDHRLVD